MELARRPAPRWHRPFVEYRDIFDGRTWYITRDYLEAEGVSLESAYRRIRKEAWLRGLTVEQKYQAGGLVVKSLGSFKDIGGTNG